MKSLFTFFLFICSLYFYQAQTNVVFNYDNAGNQISRLLSDNYSNQSSSSIISTILKQNNKTEEELFWEKVQIYPVPVKNILTITWNTDISNLVSNINLYEHNTLSNLFSLNTNHLNNRIEINMTGYNIGVYIISFTLKNGKIYTHNIIKE